MDVVVKHIELAWFASRACCVVGTSSNITMSTILDEIFENYDKKLPPKFDREHSDRQVEVVVSIYVISMYSISEANMDYSMSMHLRERWVDERLRYTDVLNLTRLELDTSLFEKVWVPDMYILNEKSSNYHEVTVLNKMMHVYPDGTVQLSARVTGLFSCSMNLQKYPFDTQTCFLELESYGHSTENMRFVWKADAVSVAEDIKFPQFSLAEIKPYSCEKNYYGILFPCIGVKFILGRNYAYHIVQIYIPSILIVILSWVSFWLDCTSVPARVSLSLLTVLTITTQSSGARANLPRVSYIKAIDIYMATCLAFVFLGLLEFAYVNVLTRKETKPSKDAQRSQNTSVSSKQNNGQKPELEDYTTKDNHCGLLCFRRLSNLGRARLVDKISRFVFPTTFFVFNLVYWLVYFIRDPQLEN
ncbi:glycine receptor subunit alpha-2-like isoform X1 [Mercenaria mercenaria]|uniref:glycine receptor subunit alpha-2-like isoform X1 n=2 Tax=Mercenaria mercenaria TaxID=6596 RepID=UPI00234E5E76|nr:glycine receptor subunit alpha-2-like isoform X1 [Mercenaria mercenaria]XP_053399984.1 glycine receptor subunit alpha-2-like isoform X1 [Mercenaria mercenaria]